MTKITPDAIIKAVSNIGFKGPISFMQLIEMYANGDIHPSRTLWFDDTGGILWVPSDRKRWRLPIEDDPPGEIFVKAFQFASPEDELANFLSQLGIVIEHS